MYRMKTTLLAVCLTGCLQSLKPMPASAPAPSQYKACGDVSECVIVDISCDGCCQRDAVNRKDSAEYEAHKGRTCVGRQESICDCCSLPAETVCEQGLCQLRILSRDCR
jgi:hypothetical protein